MNTFNSEMLRDTVQAHFSVAEERDWSLYLFFRILPIDAAHEAIQALKDLKLQLATLADDTGERALSANLSGAMVEPGDVSGDNLAKVKTTERFGSTSDNADQSAPFLAFLRKLLNMEGPGAPNILENYVQQLGVKLPDAVANTDEKENHWLSQGLAGVCAHECLRYAQGSARTGPALLRHGKPKPDQGAVAATGNAPPVSAYSKAAVNIAFTYGGMAALTRAEGKGEKPLLDQNVLNSFPEAFRQGMAARAKMLGDVGPSAPEYWDGELGRRSIHGLLTAYFEMGETAPASWKRLRDEVKKFNEGNAKLRATLSILFRGFGLEVVHIELGEDPFDEIKGHIERRRPRTEHFGFRDGISQPFVNLRLKTPRPGGGRPAKDGTWAPVAAGEIYLGPPDEDELTADTPVNETLRNGGTYLVFRKLEQDVAGFNAFLANHRETAPEQERLAAQFVGRWRSGAPLVRHPNADASHKGEEADASINDFRYFAEDPRGDKCPIGAHVRRANPRDTGGRGDVKRHRLLRRGMAYGGSLLGNAPADGQERGLLFMAANSRIELQFEVIQRDWLNGGEFLGQVGAGRCPLTGANAGAVPDRFLEAGAIAPICGIPAFVTTKGGDYFYVPSIMALEMLAREEDVIAARTPYSSSLTETPALLNATSLKAHSIALLKSLRQRRDKTLPQVPQLKRAIRVRMPDQLLETGVNVTGETMVFIGHYDDVAKVLGGTMPADCPASGEAPRRDLEFAVDHYLQASREITRGGNLLLAMDPSGPLDGDRRHRLNLMRDAWDAQVAWTNFSNGTIRNFIREIVDGVEHRVAQSGQIDILQDLAFYIPYRIVKTFVGLSGPEHLSELVVALPFAKRHITNLPGDWLTGRRDERVSEPGYASMQMWARLAFADVIGNIWRKREFTEAAIQATSEMFTYIDEQINQERLRQLDSIDPPKTLLAQLVRLAPSPRDEAHFAEVRMILADVMTTICMNIALPFSKAIQGALEFRFDLARLLKLVETQPPSASQAAQPDQYDVAELLGYELLRLFPSAPAIFRRCQTDTPLPSGPIIRKGEWVAALLGVAGRDPKVFPDPEKFSLGEYTPSSVRWLGGPEAKWPARDPKSYLLFGPPCGVHRCWGERLGGLVLGELFRAAARFKGLTRVAGPSGEVAEFPPRMDYGLRLKFHPFDPNDSERR